ncbi:MAG TPA: DUF456 domain-containing protein [Micromonosporaceae bacterium]
MAASDIDTAATIICAVAIVVGILGTVVPFVPGLVLCWGGVLVWAIFADRGSGVWITFGVVSVLALLGLLLKYLVPGRRMQRSGVPTLSLASGGLLGIVGFFVIPVVGLVAGFVLGIFLAELIRLSNARQAWPSTWQAVKAVGLSMLIEIGAGVLILAVWVWSVVIL